VGQVSDVMQSRVSYIYVENVKTNIRVHVPGGCEMHHSRVGVSFLFFIHKGRRLDASVSRCNVWPLDCDAVVSPVNYL